MPAKANCDSSQKNSAVVIFLKRKIAAVFCFLRQNKPEDAEITEKNYTCILSVRCDTILNNIQWLSKEKADIVPENGVIFEEKAVTFYEGESVFNLLVREMKKIKFIWNL